LALQIAQVVQLRAADAAAANHLDTIDRGGVEREDALDTDAARYLPHGEGLADAAALAADDDTLEHLDALLVPLDHLHVHAHGVPGAEIRHTGLQKRGFDASQRFHDWLLIRFGLNADTGGRPPGCVDSGWGRLRLPSQYEDCLLSFALPPLASLQLVPLLGGESCALDQVRALLQGGPDRLPLAPALDGRVVTREQDLGHGEALHQGRPGVVRLVEEAGPEAVPLHRAR